MDYEYQYFYEDPFLQNIASLEYNLRRLCYKNKIILKKMRISTHYLFNRIANPLNTVMRTP